MFMTILLTVNIDESDSEFMIRIYNDFYSIVKHTILYLVDDKQYVEDVVQECFISLISKLHLLKQLGLYQLNAYIIITAKRKAYDFNKKRFKRVLREQSSVIDDENEIWENIATEGISIEEIIEWKQYHEDVMGVLNKLPIKYRDALILKYQYSWSDEDIAEQIGIKSDGVRMYIKRGRGKLIKLMKEAGKYEFK